MVTSGVFFSFNTCQVAYQYLHCTTELTLYLSVQRTFATDIVYELYRKVGLVLLIHFL